MFGEIPTATSVRAAGQEVPAFPALVDEDETVALRLLPDADAQYESMWLGTRRLLRLNVGGAARRLNDHLDHHANLALAVSPHGSKVAWVLDASDAIFNVLLTESGGPVWNESGWDELLGKVRGGLAAAVDRFAPAAAEILVRFARLRGELEGAAPGSVAPARQDMFDQMQRLVYDGHLAGVGAHRWADVARYLQGIEVRLEKLGERVVQDRQLMDRCQALEADFDAITGGLAFSPEIEELNWQLEEFRLSMFAQQVVAKSSSRKKVSEKTIRAALRRL